MPPFRLPGRGTERPTTPPAPDAPPRTLDALAPPAEGAPAPAAPDGAAGPGVEIPFDALTEDWRLIGTMRIEGRLSDVLDRRQPVQLSDVRWGPADGSVPPAEAPGLRSVDPYDLIIVVTDDNSLPNVELAARAAAWLHKVTYEVLLEVPPFRVLGTIHLFPRMAPASVLDRSNELFIAVTDAVVFRGEQRLDRPRAITALVNRAYLTGVEQVEAETRDRLAGRRPGARSTGPA